MEYDVVIVAAGKGLRANLGFNKALYRMKNGRTVVENSCDIFLNDSDCRKVILVTNDEIKSNNERLIVVRGGRERYNSVMNGLEKVDSEYVLIHDAVRPFLRKEALEEVKEKLGECDAVILGKKSRDTVKIINGDRVLSTVDRDIIFLTETPQAFRSKLIKDCYARWDGRRFTDDASLLESQGIPVSVVFDRYDNTKLTSEEDFEDI